MGILDVPAQRNAMPSIPAYSLQPSNLTRWRKALARVRSGQGDAVVLCVGDSTTFGKGGLTDATSQPLGSWPTYLAAMLNSVVPAARGLIVPPTSLSSGNDNRWTVGSGWVAGANSFGAGGGSSWKGTASSVGTLVFADNGVTADVFDIYYLGSTTGSFTATATGNSAVTINTANGTPNIYKSTVAAASAGTTNTLTLQWSAGSNVYIVGVVPRLTTVSKVRVGNAGVGSSATANWIATTNPANSGGRSLIKAVAADLTIISLGINDSNASVDAATYMANMNLLISDAQVSGDVLLMSAPPTNVAAGIPLLPQYQAGLAAKGLPFLDWYARVGSYASASALGEMFDGVHPNGYGYAAIAEAIKTVLLAV